MGFFGKKGTSSNRPSDDDIHEAPIADDPEKQLPVYDDDVQTALPQIPPPMVNIDPAVEARLLRKLDLRVPTLMGFLCRSSLSEPVFVFQRAPNDLPTDLLSLLDRSNIGFVNLVP
jgi:hypothetical protein